MNIYAVSSEIPNCIHRRVTVAIKQSSLLLQNTNKATKGFTRIYVINVRNLNWKNLVFLGNLWWNILACQLGQSCCGDERIHVSLRIPETAINW